jgi:hypothetical protein
VPSGLCRNRSRPICFPKHPFSQVVRGDDANRPQYECGGAMTRARTSALLKSHVASYLRARKRLTGTTPRLGRLSAVG